ncbi:helix-turn-helix domain-containing protein [Lacticaseibacillus sharpeae]|uniref:HTH cro/C1-type domain-containing protein n=2 Tax=Lacticaseibacillus sharpeae TaxID=1626 RepID=A0A0R1ZMJ7_9LACO|nr:helix-turn-helix transcriptional regulator [Lacticaseibacillus sharpeae]KRM54324.1 hypothetical protein FC18_GL000543 [Lacticaseibacillus sharpeae JCM 1186 = DSM 20505]
MDTNSAKHNEPLGQKINELRKQKNITINRLCTYCGISKATYVRIINDKTEIRLSVLQKIIALLRIDYRELSDTSTQMDLPVLVLQRLEKLIYAVSPDAEHLAPEFYTLQQRIHDRAISGHNDGFRELDQLCRIVSARAQDELQVSRDVATQLIQRPAAYGAWTAFERGLAIDAMPFLPYSQIVTVVTRIKHDALDCSAEWPEPALYTDQMNHMYLFLLAAAVDTGQLIPMRNAITTINKFAMNGDNMNFRLVRQLAHICSLHLDRNHKQAMSQSVLAESAVDFLGALDATDEHSAIEHIVTNCLTAIEATDWSAIN